jgi:hypothetical protein
LCDDVEGGEGGWEARGFVRHNNVLAQTFIVQVIVPDGSGGVEVLRIPLDEANRGEIEVHISGAQPAVLAISGATRYTTETTTYRYEVTLLGE